MECALSCWFAIASAVATMCFMYSEYRDCSTGRWLFKPLASFLFVATGVAAAGRGTGPGNWILAGLVLGALGDILLIPKGSAAFLAGLASFLLGHLAYTVAFVARGVDTTWAVATLPALAAAAYLVSRWLLPKVEPKMKAPVLVYMVVISAMVAFAVGTWRLHGSMAWLLAAFAFYLSDLSVARDRFVSPGFVNKAWGLPLYYGAQIGFALTAVTD